MRVIPWNDLVAGRQRVTEPVRLTIGVFDGLHVGHRRLMEAIVQNRTGQAALVVTFPQNPVKILSPAQFPGLILSYRQKLSRLSELGIDLVVAIDFSDEMSNLSERHPFDCQAKSYHAENSRRAFGLVRRGSQGPTI